MTVATAMTAPEWGSLGDRLDVVFRIGGDQPAVQFRHRWWTWADLEAVWRGVRAAAPDDVLSGPYAIAIVARNHPAVWAAVLGMTRARRTWAALNPMYPDRALADDIEAVRPRCLLASPEDAARPDLRARAQQLGIQLIELPGEPGGAVLPLTPPGQGEGWFPASADVAVSMLTSGTTGAAKRIAIPAGHLRATVIEAQAHAGMDFGPLTSLGKGVSILSVPLAHIGSLFGLLMTVTQGRKASLLERFEPRAWADLVHEHQVVVGSLPPAAIRSLLDAGIPREKLASLRYLGAGAAPLRLEDAAELYERYGIPVLQAYGATEFAGGVSSFTARDHRKWGNAKRGSVGRAHPGIELKVVDLATGAELAAGERGRLLVRSSHSADSDAQTWVETNDLATVDADGFLFIHGRLDDVIIRGGFKIDPAEVERVLLQHPAVREAAVVAAPDRRLGQVPVAGVAVREGAAPSEADLREWVRARLSPYKVPTVIGILPQLPRNVSMKVIRPALLEAVLGGPAEEASPG